MKPITAMMIPVVELGAAVVVALLSAVFAMLVEDSDDTVVPSPIVAVVEGSDGEMGFI
jgi:hypothetical protein